MNPRTTRNRQALAMVTAGLLLLGGCGKGGDKKTDDALDSTSPGARNFQGRFENVSTAPAGAPKVTGLAEMTVADGRTRVDVLVAGLDGKSTYIAHVHSDVCSASDPGGAHFKFKSDGGDKPPNEIHIPIALAVDTTGAPASSGTKGGTGDVTVDGEAGSDAKSVVIHILRKPGATADEAKPPKLACADLKPADEADVVPTSEATEEPTSEPSPSASAKAGKTPKPSKTAKPKKSAAPEDSAEPTDSPEPSESPSPQATD